MEGQPDDDELGRGQTIGRYVVLDRLGRGAMGSVYAAYDPELARRVALKVLRPLAAKRQGEDVARRRLLREAQALAQLSHPHVVSVYDVGAEQGRVFLAMELVEGQSLRRWLAKPRRCAEVMEVLEQAGRGLAAAHALGLVHRDFKPDNVLIDEDGRVRVGDFGLARWFDRSELSEEASVESGRSAAASSSALAPILTAVGDALGTPAYMAPEQHAGEAIGPAADQYAFCVTLFEGLYGRRPFEQQERAAIEQAKRQAPVVDGGPRGAAGPVPSAVRAVIRQGLSLEPEQRFASMERLLEAMAQARPGVGTTWSTIAGLGLCGLVVAGVLALSTDEPSVCAEAGQPPDDAWNSAARQALEQRLGQTLDPDAIVRTVGALERRADAWVAEHRQACEDTWVRGEQSSARLDARMECLQQQWSELRETVALLREADEATAERSVELALGLPPASVCAAVQVRSQVVHAPPSEREQTGRLLARVRALRRAARHDEAWAEFVAWDERSEREQEGTAESAARALMRGQLLEDRGEYVKSDAEYRRALRLAKLAQDARAEADAWLSLSSVVSEHAHDEPRARFLANMGIAAVRAVGGDDRIMSWAHTMLGSLSFVAGDDAGAREHWEQALELRLALFGEHHPMTAASINNLGGVLYGQGEYEAAEQQMRRALQIREGLYGPDHPVVAESAANLGLLMQAVSRGDEAVRLHRRALEIQRRHLGPDHPALIRMHDGLAQALFAVGQRAQAKQHWTRVRQMVAEHFAPRHPLLATPLMGLAEIALEDGKLDDADALSREAVAIAADDSLGPGARAHAWWRRGLVLEARGGSEAAREAMRTALEHAREAGAEGEEVIDDVEAWLGVVPTSPG